MHTYSLKEAERILVKQNESKAFAAGPCAYKVCETILLRYVRNL